MRSSPHLALVCLTALALAACVLAAKPTEDDAAFLVKNKPDLLKGVPRQALALFAVLDENNDNVINSDEIALYLDRFFDDEKAPKLKMKSDIKSTADLREPFYKLIQDMSVQLFQKPIMVPTSAVNAGNDAIYEAIDSQFSVTFEEFIESFKLHASKFHHKYGSLSANEDEDPNCPYQVHVAQGKNNQQEAVIIWVTKNQINESQLFIGTQPDALTQALTGTVYTYNVGILGGWHHWLHKVQISNLQAFTRYYYKVGAPICYSKVFNFKTAPATAEQAYPQSLLVFGDQGTFMPMGMAVMQTMLKQHQMKPFDLVLHVGDLSYAGTGGGWEISNIWDLWFWQIEPIAAYVPWMTTVGNHESFYNFTAYEKRLEMPGSTSCKGTDSCTNYYYSYDFGGLHIVSTSSEAYKNPYGPTSDQIQWLENDLIKANANRDRVPWIVVLAHRPYYSSDNDTNLNEPRIGIEPYLIKHKVDFTITGHMHCYERTTPVNNLVPVMEGASKNYYLNPQAPFHLVIGNAGAWIHEKWNPMPDWSVHRELDYGFGRLDVHNATHIHFQLIRHHDNQVADEMWLIKNKH